MSHSPPAKPVDTTPPSLQEKAAGEVGAGEIVEVEIGGRGGLDPTRYGDWEKNGRCIDF